MSETSYVPGVDLAKENQILAENLSKCMEEKNFVWSLWKKLQTEKPDLSSVVSLVMAREKEKTEVRDGKVLKILETKDAEIQQLEKEKDGILADLKQKNGELNAYSLRLHDLLIEKAELQESLESVRTGYEEKLKGLVEENGYLSEVVRARQLQIETDEDKYKMRLEDVDQEKRELHKVVRDLEVRLGKFNEDRFMNSAVIEENSSLKDTLRSIKEEFTTLKNEHEDAMSALKLRESQLQKHFNLIQEHTELLNEKENVITVLRNDLNEIKMAHSHCGEHAKEQATLIENLQSLQEQTTAVIKDQEEKFKSEILVLKEQLVEKEKGRSLLEKDLQNAKQECNKCGILEQELQTMKEQNEELYDVTQEKNRRISSLEKMLVYRKDEMGNSSYSDTLDKKCKTSEQKNYELKKVLEFKQKELDTLAASHSNRLERYKNLQHEHKIVLKQLKTFETQSDEEALKRQADEIIPRASPRALQKENSDSVWNELQHFKNEYEMLQRERDAIMEEIDVLRVEHANDVTTIHELRMCLEDEKRDLLAEIKFNNAQEKDDIKKGIKLLEKEKDEAVRQVEKQKKDITTIRKENESLKGNVSEQEGIVERLALELSKCKKESKAMKSREKKRNEKNEQKERDNGSAEKTENEPVKEPQNFATKQVQTDVTYEEQLQEATRRLILDATRDITQHSHSHSHTQTSPFKTITQPSHDPQYTRIQSVSMDVLSTADESGASLPTDRSAILDASQQQKYETPSRKLRSRTKSPIHREWKTMRQRVLSLTQQVAALKATKESLTKLTNEQKITSEKVQSELNQCQQRLKLSKQTSERLTKELEECTKQKQALTKASKEYKVPSYPTEKHLEDRLKLSSNECSRLSCELKTARKTNAELEEKLKSCQERNTRQEHLLTQKKVFVEEMRTRLKLAQENLESATEELKRTGEKSNQRKTQLDALKRQLESEANHRQKFERLHEQNQEQLRKKAQLLDQAQSLRQEAEVAVNEMEEAAKNQLHSLANQSQVTLKSIEVQLTKARRRIEELEGVVRTLMGELVQRLVRIKIASKQEEFQRNEEVKNKASMVQACELASSILNMSKADIDDLLDVDLIEEENSSNYSDVWERKVEQELSKQDSFSSPLLHIFMEIIEDLTGVQNVE